MKYLLRIIKYRGITSSKRIAYSIGSLLFLIVISQCFSSMVLAQAQLGEDIDGEAADDLSGYSVSLSANGQRLAIGAPFSDDNGDNSGHVRVYQWSDTGWAQLGADIAGEAANDVSGGAVSLSGFKVYGAIDPDDAPSLLFHGTADSIVTYSSALTTWNQAVAAGVDSFLTTWNGAGHVPYVQHRTEILDQTTNFLYWELDLENAAQ